MQIELPAAELSGYKSPSQRARVATEIWAGTNLYCVNCDSPRVAAVPHNTPVIDFLCQRCRASYQLKSQSRPLLGKITDAGYEKMCEAIRDDRTPNLFAMHYDSVTWQVRRVILVPRFAFSEAAIEKRKPLGPGARRAGWVGCNILLGQIPPDARLSVIEEGNPTDPEEVRRNYSRLKSLAKIEPRQRGWTLDVLTAVRSLGKQSFTLAEAYSLEREIAKLHPANRHVRDKIRQQLQVLRDAELLDFVGRGKYRLRL